MSSLTDSELNTLVAEEVMGWKVLAEDRSRVCKVLNKKGTAAGMLTERLPPFATDDGLALQAALKEISQIGITEYSDGSFSVNNSDFSIIATASTLARALCLAALRAVGEQVEDDL